MNTIQLVPHSKVSASAVKQAEDLLEICQSGECVGFTVIIEIVGGQYRVAGSSVMSRLQTSGALLEAAIDRLKL
jgi:hypothetical protein